MKKELFAACSGVIFAASLVAQPVTADEQDYVAKATEDGKFVHVSKFVDLLVLLLKK